MQRFKVSILAAAGLLVLAGVMTVIGPKRVMAALGYTPVRDIDYAARQPLLVQLDTTYHPIYRVPVKQRLVIEFVSFYTSVNKGGLYSVSLQTWDAALTGFTHTISFPLTLMSRVDSLDSSAFASATKIYVDPGTALKVDASITPGTQSATVDCTFSGYLEPVP